MNRIALGTAQFGLSYGINNSCGKMPVHEVFQIMEEAGESGTDTIDTAYCYGSSEELIGEFAKQNNAVHKFKIVSKLPKCKQGEAENKISLSLERLRLKSLYGYLLHDFNMYKEEPKIWDFFLGLRNKGLVEKIGVSLYYTDDLELILNNRVPFDLVQVPYSIFDRRFEDYFEILRQKNIEIQVRSLFLQGIVFIKPDALEGPFLKIREKLLHLNKLSQKNNIGIIDICLNFALLNKFIDKVVVGVDNLSQFKEISKSLKSGRKVNLIQHELGGLREENEEILLPFNWGIRKGLA